MNRWVILEREKVSTLQKFGDCGTLLSDYRLRVKSVSSLCFS